MIVLVLIEVEDEPTAADERKTRQRLAQEIAGDLNYCCEFTVHRIDVAGVDGVSEQGIIEEIPHPLPPGRRRRVGVECGCGERDCVRCYEPDR